MKTTRDTLLVVFVSFISITRLARCGASTILDDRDKETEEIEELVRKEVFSSLQFLSEDEDEDFESTYPKPIRNGNQDSGRYYQLSNQSPPRKAQVSGNSYNIPEYSSSSSYYGGPSKPFNNQEVRTNGGSKTGRSIDVPSPAVSSMNTREPDDYSTTITLPSLGGGRLFYGGGGYGGGAGYSGGGGAGYSGGGDYGGSGIYNGLAGTARRMRPSALLRRGVRRLGRYGSGLAGGNGFRYGLGTGGLTGLLGGAGLQGANLGFGGGAGRAGGGGSGGGYYADYSGDGVNLSGGGGRRGYNGNARYGLQGDTSGSGGSWSVGGGSDGAPSEYYNFRYGYPGSSATVDGNSGGGGSRRYTVSYPNDATGNTVSTADGVNPQQYELMFLRNQQQNGSNQDADLQLNAGSSGANRDTSSNGAGYRLNVSGSPSTTTSNPGGVEEYRVVVVNKDSPGNGSGRSGVSMSSTGSAPGGSGSGSWSMSSSGSSGGSGSGGRTGQGGFQLTTPITSTQVSIPPTSIVGSVLSTVQGAATGEQTRSLGVSNNPPAGKFIQVIPLKNV